MFKTYLPNKCCIFQSRKYTILSRLYVIQTDSHLDQQSRVTCFLLCAYSLFVHTSILPAFQDIYPIPPPFHFQGAQGVLLSAQTQCSFVPHTHICKLLSSLSFAVQKPDTFHRFLTTYDVRKRKKHIGLTISCEQKTNF